MAIHVIPHPGSDSVHGWGHRLVRASQYANMHLMYPHPCIHNLVDQGACVFAREMHVRQLQGMCTYQARVLS